MKIAIVIGAIFAGLLAFHFGLGTQIVSAVAALTPAPPPPLFGCRAPSVEGEITQITIDVRAGQLVGECQYASTRQSKPKKGG